MEKRQGADENIRHMAHAQALRAQAYFGYEMIVCPVGRLPSAPFREANGPKEKLVNLASFLEKWGAGLGERQAAATRSDLSGRWRGEEGGELA